MDRRRWDTDERGHGITDARRFLPDARALELAMDTDDWIAEEPEAHLLPHLERAIEASGGRWHLTAERNDDGLLEMTLLWTGHDDGRPAAALRADAFALIGQVAETASLVRERREGDDAIFEITTGMLEGDGHFAPHGHMVRLRVRGLTGA